MARKHVSKKTFRLVRHRRLRSRLIGTASRPRLSVFRSRKHIFVQLIDDGSQQTILSVSDHDIAKATKDAKAAALAVGQLIAQRAKDAGIQSVVFDRGGFAYHGRVKAIAEGARKEGLQF